MDTINNRKSRYISFEEVIAEPMTREEHNKQYSVISPNNNPDEGYNVICENGEVRWVPKSIFEKSFRMMGNPLLDSALLMKSSDFKDRFKAEYYQLKNRMEGLSNMLVKYKEGTLGFTPNCSYEILENQLNVMKQYAEILEERARIEYIEL